MEKVTLNIENGHHTTKHIIPVEVNGERILTTEQLAGVYEVDVIRIQQGFIRNKDKFQIGKHYFRLIGKELKEFKGNYLKDSKLKYASELILWTERGANRHCKILDTDRAWEQFDNLEETYFRVKEKKLKEVAADPYKGLSKEVQAIFAIDKKTQEIENRVNSLEDNMPLFNVECKELQALVRKTGIRALGGYKSSAYKNNPTRCKVYADIQHQLKREFGISRYEAIKRSQLEIARNIIREYIVPIVLQNEIEALNSQIGF